MLWWKRMNRKHNEALLTFQNMSVSNSKQESISSSLSEEGEIRKKDSSNLFCLNKIPFLK